MDFVAFKPPPPPPPVILPSRPPIYIPERSGDVVTTSVITFDRNGTPTRSTVVEVPGEETFSSLLMSIIGWKDKEVVVTLGSPDCDGTRSIEVRGEPLAANGLVDAIVHKVQEHKDTETANGTTENGSERMGCITGHGNSNDAGQPESGKSDESNKSVDTVSIDASPASTSGDWIVTTKPGDGSDAGSDDRGASII